jgi:DNA repair photolyase
MSLIYVPSGKAREYSPLSMNIFNGCDHGCSYCYVPSATRRPYANSNPLLRKNVLHLLEREVSISNPQKQILLCFLCDPYSLHDEKTATTRSVIEIFKKYKTKIAILSKGGNRALRDLDLFKLYPKDCIKFGSTLTFTNDTTRIQYEPNASNVSDRFETMRIIHDAGIKTFASIEPVIDLEQSLECIEKSLPFTDQYKIGKLNHNKEIESKIDWKKFLSSALSITRSAGKEIYIKEDLRKAAPSILLSEQECDMDFLTLK